MTGVREAIRDLLYLLNRGYPRESAVNFVSNHHRLPLVERHLLARCVFSDKEAREHRRRAVGLGEVKDRRLGIDGYNVLITIESLLMGKRVVLCNDGFVRDLRAIFGKYRAGPVTPRAIAELIGVVARAKPREVVVFFDKQVSRSGELAADFRRRIEATGLKGGSFAVSGVDRKLGGFEVVASSDRAVIQRAKKVWDIPRELIRSGKRGILDVKELINSSSGK